MTDALRWSVSSAAVHGLDRCCACFPPLLCLVS